MFVGTPSKICDEYLICVLLSIKNKNTFPRFEQVTYRAWLRPTWPNLNTTESHHFLPHPRSADDNLLLHNRKQFHNAVEAWMLF